MLDQPEQAESDDDIGAIGQKALFGPGSQGAKKFALKARAPICDIVMKGGVTSGVVYPYAVMRLAQKFRLAGIGGTSAGAIAAALTAAAEYGRQAKQDPESFSRFEAQCMRLPAILGSLFQPYLRHRAIFTFLTLLMEVMDSAPPLRARLASFARIFRSPAAWVVLPILAGAALGGVAACIRYVYFYSFHIGPTPSTGPLNPGVAAALVGGATGLAYGVLLILTFAAAVRFRKHWPMWVYLGLTALAAAGSILGKPGGMFAIFAPAALGGGLGVVAACVFIGDRVIAGLRATDFGLCPGTGQSPGAVGLMDWLHAAIQDVAGRKATDPPLTFGEVENAASSGPKVALRMIVTNLTLRRPYALPDLGGGNNPVGWKPSEWEALFPASVIAHLTAGDDRALAPDQVRPLPSGWDLPVLVGARMSLSFPLLFSAVPIYDLAETGPPSRMLLIDGGLSSNLPLHFFDSLGPPVYPTFAFNLTNEDSLKPAKRSWIANLVEESHAELPPAQGDEDLDLLSLERISMLKRTDLPPRLPKAPHGYLHEYLDGLLGAAKDWQDNLLSVMPGQCDRIVTIKLAPGEGGLNLAMPPKRSERLMRLGYLAGRKVANDFVINDHRIRRALAAYEEIERVAEKFGGNWITGNLEKVLSKASAPADSKATWRMVGPDVIKRLSLLASWSAELTPIIRHDRFPRPRGSLRITPNLSGDS